MEVDIVGVVELLLFNGALALKEPGLGVFDLRHGVKKVSASGSADVLDQRLMIERRLSIEGKPAAHFIQQIGQLLGVDVQRV